MRRLEQRAGDRHLGGLDRAVVAARGADAHQRRAGAGMTDFTSAKSRLIRPGVVIRSVMPETPWTAAPGRRCLKASSIADAAVGDRQQPVVGDDDEGVDLVAQLVDARLGLAGATAALEAERPGDDADGQRAQRAGDARDDRRAAGAGAAALAGGDEDHVGALEDLLDLLGVVLGGLRADLGVGAGAEAAGELAADVELDVGVAHQQRLRVGVDRDELDALEADLDHPVDGVDAAAADADDLDDREVVLRCCHVGASHCCSPLGCGDSRLSWEVPGRNPHPQVEPYSYVNLRL